MDQGHLDSLLAKHLELLDEYTRLRNDVSRHQSSIYHHIARANFSAERGLRYGKDQYDGRMQAQRRVTIDEVDEKTSWSVSAATEEITEDDKTPKDEKDENSQDADAQRKQTASKKKDPLRWFGLLTPQPLRSAQQEAISLVEQAIPRLVTVNVEMLGLEIQIRRARKKRAKASLNQDLPGRSEGGDMAAQTTPLEAK